MKLIVLLLLITSFQLCAQDTLAQKNTFMFSEYFILHKNNRFDYRYSHCTGVEVGSGYYKEGLFNLKFEFDSIPVLNDTVVAFYDPSSEFVNVKVLSVHDSSQIDYCILKSGGTSYYHQTDSGYNLPIITDSVSIMGMSFAKFSIYPQKDSCNTYRVYINEVWRTFVSGDKVKLKKKSNNSYTKEVKSRQKNEEKPWRKGKGYKTRIIYEFR